MQLVELAPLINKRAVNNQFIMQKSILCVMCTAVVTNKNKNFHFFQLTGKVNVNTSEGEKKITVDITQSTEMPLFVNKSGDGFYLYQKGSLKMIMDLLEIDETTEFNEMRIPVICGPKGYWLIDIEALKCNK